jgi:2-dehydro-3-deoxygluconokinase
MKAAKKHGAVVSFDLNFRAKLWKRVGGPARAQKVLREIARYTDVLVGNEEDLQLGLGVKGPEVESSASKLDPAAFLAMMDNVVKEFPNISVVATTLREVRSTNSHGWGTVLWMEGKTHVSPICELDVLCRIGGGDGFAAGLFYGLMSGETPDQAVRLGWAHGAMITTTPGDTTMVTLDQVKSFAAGGSARVQR